MTKYQFNLIKNLFIFCKTLNKKKIKENVLNMAGKKTIRLQVRDLVIRKYNNGENKKAIAESLQLNASTVGSIIRTFELKGRVEAKTTRSPKEKKICDESKSKINTFMKNIVQSH